MTSASDDDFGIGRVRRWSIRSPRGNLSSSSTAYSLTIRWKPPNWLRCRRGRSRCAGSGVILIRRLSRRITAGRQSGSERQRDYRSTNRISYPHA
jgi:hypothetical protein